MNSWASAAFAAAFTFPHRRVEPPVADVLGDGPVEQERVLTHVADRLAEVRETSVAHVVTVDVVERDGVRRVLDATGTSISPQMHLPDARAS